MIMCRQVSKALANHRYYELPRWKRAAMFLHIKLCVMCGESNQQIVDFQKGVHDFLEHEEQDEVQLELSLSPEARSKIQKAVKEES